MRPDNQRRRSRDQLRICLAAAPGGHLTEILKLSGIYREHRHFFVVNENAARTTDLGCPVYYVPDYGVGGRLRRSLSVAQLTALNVRVWLKERPNVLISTGPFTGFGVAVLVRITGGRVIYVECSAQVTNPSRSGRLYRHVAHRFFVQWPSLLEHYPNGEYRGLLL